MKCALFSSAPFSHEVFLAVPEEQSQAQHLPTLQSHCRTKGLRKNYKMLFLPSILIFSYRLLSYTYSSAKKGFVQCEQINLVLHVSSLCPSGLSSFSLL